MPRSYSSVYVHVVFGTKERIPFLTDSTIREEVHRYLGDIANKLDCKPVVIGGVADHVHMLVALGRSISLADLAKEVKRVSTGWIHKQFPELSRFEWQGGYGSFSVDPAGLAQKKKYIENQEEHHRTVTFQEEFIALLIEHGIEYDERYLWN